MFLIDTHAHLTYDDFESRQAEILQRASAAGVQNVISIATDLTSSRACIQLAENHPGVFASIGVHPNHAHEAVAGDWEQIVACAEHPRVVAVGETGLDLHWDDCPFEIQQDWFQRHAWLSREFGLPMVIHQRDCEPEMLEALERFAGQGELLGVMHSFAGSWETARRCLDLGLYISFAGMVTFKNAQDLRDVARQVPADRILVETDSPFLSPHPHRGKRPNEPARVVHTAAAVAAARGESLSEFARLATANTLRLFSRMAPR